jgi:benzoyl-CoA reductase subunit C
MLETACEREKVPFTSFKYAENTGQVQVIREQAGAFSDAVRLWEAAP